MTSDYLWWRDGVVYQIYPRSFADSNGDGVGDLRGIVGRLDYLADLGVDAIWLSPINRSPMKDFGYDVSDYRDVDPVFGTLADFDTLLREAHARGIRIVMDMVMNHTADEHPWFVESRSGRDNPRRNWYIWRGPRPADRPPNNWQSMFGGPAWDFDPRTGEYYLHLFLPGQPDLNWSNPEVMQAMKDVWHFWLDRGVDGFRLDVAHFFAKHPGLPDNRRKLGLRGWDRQHHDFHMNLPETHGIWKEFRRLLDEYPERMAVGEVAVEGAEGYYGNGHDELHLVFNFRLLRTAWRASLFRHAIADWEARLPDGAWPCWVLSNHDVKRSISRWAARQETEARARVAATLLLTLRGTPFMFYGEEIGMREGDIPRAELVDPPGRRFWPFYKGRDGCRTPMQWTPGTNAGFTTGTPWLRVASNSFVVNVEREQADPASLLSYYRRLIALRRSTPALHRGTHTQIPDAPDGVMAYFREHAGQRILVGLNFKARPVRFGLPAAGDSWRVLISTHAGRTGSLRDAVTLAPNEALILEAS